MPKKQGTSSSPKSVKGAVGKVSRPLHPPRLWERYRQEIIPKLKKDLGYRSHMEVPCLEKIVINRGVGIAIMDKGALKTAIEELTMIAGQRAVPTQAKRSVSNFKLREGMSIGARVTLRRRRMYEFLDRLMSVALPRVRDFQGVSTKSFDLSGNYTLGIKEQIIFPEISIDKVSRFTGMDITFVSSARTPKEGQALLAAYGLPFRK